MNPALDTLLDDYTRYHRVFVVVGAPVVVALSVLTVWLWARSRRAPRVVHATRSFERTAYVSLAVASTLFTAFLALALAANVSTVRHPAPGFAPLADAARMVETPQHRLVVAWIDSGDETVPAAIRSAVDDRLSWQRPKAIGSTILLVACATACVLIWRTLIRRSRTDGASRRPGRGLLVAGVTTTLGSMLLVVMAIANTQATLAPLTITALGPSG